MARYGLLRCGSGLNPLEDPSKHCNEISVCIKFWEVVRFDVFTVVNMKNGVVFWEDLV
jgi:hypothetical protein